MLRSLWANHRTAILVVAVVLMGLVALPWLAINLGRLLWEQASWGAVDLRYRYEEVQLLFAGKTVYGEVGHAVYPPASYVMLWPLLGWLAFTPARVLWAASTVAMLGWLAYLCVKESGANTRLEAVFVVFMLLSMYATGFTIGHGQLTIHVLSTLVAGMILVCRDQRRWREDLVAAALILAALVKPSLAVPFFWLVIFVPRTLRPALLVVLGYLALTCVVIPFQGFDLFFLLDAWAASSVNGAAHGAVTGGYGDLHSWLASLGLQKWNVPASLLVLWALGYWIYRHRHGDLWILLGVTAIVSRFWVYHRAYDDMLVLLPMITLFRVAKQDRRSNEDQLVAGVLLAVVVMAMLATGLIVVFPTWDPQLKGLQTLVRITVLIFLFYQGSYDQRSRTRA